MRIFKEDNTYFQSQTFEQKQKEKKESINRSWKKPFSTKDIT